MMAQGKVARQPMERPFFAAFPYDRGAVNEGGCPVLKFDGFVKSPSSLVAAGFGAVFRGAHGGCNVTGMGGLFYSNHLPDCEKIRNVRGFVFLKLVQAHKNRRFSYITEAVTTMSCCRYHSTGSSSVINSGVISPSVLPQKGAVQISTTPEVQRHTVQPIPVKMPVMYPAVWAAVLSCSLARFII